MLWYQKHRVIDHGIIGECASRIVPVQLELAGAHRPGWGAAVRHPTAPAGSCPATGLRSPGTLYTLSCVSFGAAAMAPGSEGGSMNWAHSSLADAHAAP